MIENSLSDLPLSSDAHQVMECLKIIQYAYLYGGDESCCRDCQRDMRLRAQRAMHMILDLSKIVTKELNYGIEDHRRYCGITCGHEKNVTDSRGRLIGE